MCDAKYGSDTNAFDDFAEALVLVSGSGTAPGPDNVFSPLPCNEADEPEVFSPRLITIFVVDEWLGSNDPMPIKWFAMMYVEGCVDVQGELDQDCGGIEDEQKYPSGHAKVRGLLFNAFVSNVGGAGPLNPGGTQTIVLTE